MKHYFMGSYIYIIKLKIKCWILQHIIVHYSMIEVIFKMCFNQVSVIQNLFFFFLNLALLLYILMFLSFTSKAENILFLSSNILQKTDNLLFWKKPFFRLSTLISHKVLIHCFCWFIKE